MIPIHGIWWNINSVLAPFLSFVNDRDPCFIWRPNSLSAFKKCIGPITFLDAYVDGLA